MQIHNLFNFTKVSENPRSSSAKTAPEDVMAFAAAESGSPAERKKTFASILDGAVGSATQTEASGATETRVTAENVSSQTEMSGEVTDSETTEPEEGSVELEQNTVVFSPMVWNMIQELLTAQMTQGSGSTAEEGAGEQQEMLQKIRLQLSSQSISPEQLKDIFESIRTSGDNEQIAQLLEKMASMASQEPTAAVETAPELKSVQPQLSAGVPQTTELSDEETKKLHLNMQVLAAETAAVAVEKPIEQTGVKTQGTTEQATSMGSSEMNAALSTTGNADQVAALQQAAEDRAAQDNEKDLSKNTQMIPDLAKEEGSMGLFASGSQAGLESAVAAGTKTPFGAFVSDAVSEMRELKQTATLDLRNTDEFATRMVEKMQTFISQHVQEAYIELKPEYLGKMSIKMSVEGDRIAVRMEVSNQQVRELVESNFSELKNSLQEKGFSMESLNVMVQQQSQGQVPLPEQQWSAEQSPDQLSGNEFEQLAAEELVSASTAYYEQPYLINYVA